MRFAKHWERAEGSDGLVAWGWSDDSAEAATREAEERLERVRRALSEGRRPDRYAYDAQPIRELQVESFGSPERPYALVTRNAYGARVLNTRGAAFLDIDVVESEEPRAKPAGFWARLFGGDASPPRGEAPAAARSAARRRVEELVAREGGPSMRIYETHAGLRLLLTDGLHQPESPEMQALMGRLGVDPLYARLCRAQRCFRARLTAKPWRIELTRPPQRFPGHEPSRRYLEWCEGYERAAGRVNACRHVSSLGRPAADRELAQVIEIHDAQSGAEKPGELR